MIPCKPAIRKLTLFILSFVVFSVIHSSAQDGRTLFMSKCASCHNIFKDMTGPALMGLEERHKWADHKELMAWIHNPAGYMKSDPYTQGLKAKFGSEMSPSPDLTLENVSAIVAYINDEVKKKAAGDGGEADPNTASTSESDNSNAIIFGVISLILAIIALILMQVNSNLKKLSDDAEGIERPEPIPFFRNKIYIAMLAIVFFVAAGIFLAKGAIGLQRQKDYQPVQPIFYSHKVHAGLNQINCLYCHGNAWDSKTAAIPSTNVCMNCHKTITEYTGPDNLVDGNGEKVNGTAEINKLYEYAGFDPKRPVAWEPSMAKQIPWTRIHNLPDHVYFNHSQHIRAGKVQCQTCHGDITQMDEVKQFSELSMGWCINCHRQTKVDFNYDSTKGNKFYSIYEKFHKDLRADTVRNSDGTIKKIIPAKMDSVTVKDIGGLECQKCHY